MGHLDGAIRDCEKALKVGTAREDTCAETPNPADEAPIRALLEEVLAAKAKWREELGKGKENAEPSADRSYDNTTVDGASNAGEVVRKGFFNRASKAAGGGESEIGAEKAGSAEREGTRDTADTHEERALSANIIKGMKKQPDRCCTKMSTRLWNPRARKSRKRRWVKIQRWDGSL